MKYALFEGDRPRGGAMDLAGLYDSIVEAQANADGSMEGFCHVARTDTMKIVVYWDFTAEDWVYTDPVYREQSERESTV
jgi:hypothetical protein